MKKRIILIFLVIISNFTFSQIEFSKDYDYKISEPYNVVDANRKEYFSNGKEILAVKLHSNMLDDKFQVLLQKYSIEK